jgi:hypothetical protein
MASWAEFEQGAPDLAVVAARLWPGITALHRGETGHFSVAYLATTRGDGSPRLHPFCPILAAGRMFAAIPMSSPKGQDLRRDPRCTIHALPGPDDDELSIRALATEITEERVRTAVVGVVGASGVGGMIETASKDPLFAFDLIQVDVARWIDIGQPGTHAVRHRWRPASGGPGRADG